MWTSFQSSLRSVLSAKRNGLDEYNFEAKKSDKHSNDVYLGLINYINGTLVADYNMFLQYAEQNSYRGLILINYVPGFEIRTQEKVVDVAVKKFNDIPRKAVSVAPIKTAISNVVYQSLSNYISYINEMWSRTRRLQATLGSFNSSAAYYKTLETIPGPVECLFVMKIFKFHFQVTKKLSSIVKSCLPALQNP